MNTEVFVAMLKTCKLSPTLTANVPEFKLFTDKERKVWTFRGSGKVCKYCKHEDRGRVLVVSFNQRCEYLTIFQAGLLYFMFAFGKIPSDYASYHKCIAGKQFIENLDTIKLQEYS